MSAFIDSSARVEADSIGDGSRVLAYVRVGDGVTIGRDCILNDHAVLVGDVQLDDHVTVQVGARLLGRVRVEEGVTIGAGAVVGSDRPERDADGSATGEVVIRRFASLGANVTVLPGVGIGRRAVVEPGSVVTQNVPANAIVSGNPATIVAYADAGHEGDPVESGPAPIDATVEVTETRVQGVTLHRLTHATDLRGSLTAAEFSSLPFVPSRLFTVYDVPNESVRGAHAHRRCSQFLVCLAGALSCLVDDGSAREEIRLEGSKVGLSVPPMIWGTQWRYSRDAVLLVLASHPYEPEDYIRDYEEFVELRKQTDDGPG